MHAFDTQQKALVASITLLFALWHSDAISQTLVIRNVTVIPMSDNTSEIRNATVTVVDGKISSVSATSKSEACKDTCIDGTGKWLIPGLTDAHVHLENDRLIQLYAHLPAKPTGLIRNEDVFLPYIANGVTQVFDLGAMPDTFLQEADIIGGRVLGPRIIKAFMIDGPQPIVPRGVSHGVPNPEAGRQAVRDAVDAGYQIIKVYSLLDYDTYVAVVDEAKRQGLKVIGHIPGRQQGNTSKYFISGFEAVAHAEEFALQSKVPDEKLISEYANLAKSNHTALITTLTLDERILETMSNPESLKSRKELYYQSGPLQSYAFEHNPYAQAANPDAVAALKKIISFNNKLVTEFSKNGIPILTGTDSLTPGLAPGFALLDEVETLVRAGLSSHQALFSATRAPCEWLGPSYTCGQIAPGMNADMVLLDANPIQNVKNLRKIAGVVVRGTFHSNSELSESMEKLRQRNAVPVSK